MKIVSVGKRGRTVKITEKPTAMVVAKKALKVARKATAVQELKYNTNTYASTIGTTLAGFLSCVLIAQGDSGSTRDGNMIFVKHIDIRFLAYQSGNTDDYGMLRLIVVRNKRQQADTVAPIANVLETTTNISSPYPLDVHHDNFQYLYDRVIDLNARSIAYNSATTGTIVYNPAVFRRVRIKINKKVYFNGSANTDIEGGGIAIYGISAGTGATNLDMQCQTCFIDS